MNSQSVKISYGKIAVDLLILCMLYDAFIMIAFYGGKNLTDAYNQLTPFILSHQLTQIIFLQFFLFVIIAFFLLGTLSTWMSSRHIRGDASILYNSVFIGFVASTLPLLLFLFDAILKNAYITGYSFLTLFIIAAISALFTAPFIALGSYFYKRVMAKSGNGPDIKRMAGYIAGMAIILVLVLVLPLISVYILYSNGVIDNHHGVPQFSVSRLDNNTITIAFDGYAREHRPANVITSNLFLEDYGVGPPSIDMDKNYVIQILLNQKDFSNASSIEKNMINASISPLDGLKPVKGSSVTINGSDVQPIPDDPGYLGIPIEMYAISKDGSYAYIRSIYIKQTAN